jgi:malate dehydrogenase (oxaloacetate-decarboxylating)
MAEAGCCEASAIGDPGSGGPGIPIGELARDTLIGGIRPERARPLVPDVGTNHAERLHDPEYLGRRHERVTGPAYLDCVARLVRAVPRDLPTTGLQWDDFATPHARPILERYRDASLTCNDDIQAEVRFLEPIGRQGPWVQRSSGSSRCCLAR